MRVFLETDRLVLRQFTAADAESLVELNSDAEVMRFITGGRATPRDEVVTRVLPGFLSYYERFAGYGFWAVIEKSSGDFLGWFHFRPPAGGRGRGGRARLPAAPVGLGPGLCGRGVARADPHGLHRAGGAARGGRDPGRARRVPARDGEGGADPGPELSRPWPDPVTGDEHEAVQYALTRADWERQEAAGPAGPG